MKLTRYRTEWSVGNDGLKLGRGVKVKPLTLTSEPIPNTDRRIVTATVKLSIEFAQCERGWTTCSVCETEAPAPTDDALWYLLENHDSGRLAFPRAEEAFDDEQRDQYPVEGWTDGGDGLVCGECAAELEEAKEALRAKRRGSK